MSELQQCKEVIHERRPSLPSLKKRLIGKPYLASGKSNHFHLRLQDVATLQARLGALESEWQQDRAELGKLRGGLPG
jgi:hypothetical protein